MNDPHARLVREAGKAESLARGERVLRSLITLARRMQYTESSRRDAASYASFETKLFSRGRRLRVQAVWALAGLSTCAALVFGVFAASERGAGLPFFASPQLSYRMQPVGLAPASADASVQELAFSDGSRVQLAARSEANVADLTSHGARVVLDHGRAEVSIARRKQAAWQLIAGPYTVRVTGTAFRLAWSKEQEELEVAMHHGSVVVTGPMAEHGVVLGKGQRLVGSPRSRRLVVEDWPRKPEVVALTPRVDSAPERKEPIAKAAARSERAWGLSEHGWAKRVAQGEFASVLSEARALGHARVLTAAGVTDLGALADAARYARQDALGQKTLLALRERFPDSELARDSAFLLGRLSRDQRALTWYERYLSEEPSGAYVSQALGRSMMLCFELGESARAKALAERYLTRFPSGPYAASAKKLRDPSLVSARAPEDARGGRGAEAQSERAVNATP